MIVYKAAQGKQLFEGFSENVGYTTQTPHARIQRILLCQFYLICCRVISLTRT